MQLITTIKKNPLKNAARLKKIVSVFAQYGFPHLIEKAKLGRFFFKKTPSKEILQLPMEVRMRRAFEQLGPTFVKFGQLLATRPDLIPKEFCEEFKKLHDRVDALSFSEIKPVIDRHFSGDYMTRFESFDEEPIGTASIAQVYQAVLKNGDKVVVKVQRPGLDEIIAEDLRVLYFLGEMIEKYIPEAAVYNPMGIVDQFFKSLELETNFVVEANNIRRFQKNFENEPNIKIPMVYNDLSGARVLVMEKLEGTPLSQKNALNQEGIDPEQVLRTGLRCYLKMVFSYGLFHGDLHAGNFFVLPNNKIGLIDFGVVGRLNRKTQTSIANMLIALSQEDYDRFGYEYIDLAPYTPYVEPDKLARDLRDIIAPYYGLTMKNINVGRLLMDSVAVAAEHRLTLPSELVMYFKSILTIEGMGRMVVRDFDFLSFALEFAQDLVKERYDAQKMMKDVSYTLKDANSLLATLPRQIKQSLRRVNSPEFSIKMDVERIEDLRRSVETSSHMLFLSMVIGALLVSSSIALVLEKGPKVFDLPMISFVGYTLAGFLCFISFINYIKKD